VSGPVLPSSSESAWNSGGGALLSWRPYDFGVRAARVEAAHDMEDAALETLALSELEVSRATTDAFLNLAAAHALSAAAKADVERLKAFAEAVHVLVGQKLKPGVDAGLADAAEGMAQTALLKAEAEEDNQRALLAQLVDAPVETLAIKTDDLERIAPALPVEVADAASAHPEARAEAARVRKEEAQLDAASRAFAPQIDLVGGAWERGSGRSATGAYGRGDAGLEPSVGNWAVGVQVVLPLGGYPALSAQKAAQRDRLEAERARYAETLKSLTTRLATARATLKSARAIAKITPVSLEAARQAEIQQRVRFQSGLASVVDVTAAEAGLARAESEDALGRLNVWRALSGLAAAEGDVSSFQTLLSQ
jgi:outer membrane protein